MSKLTQSFSANLNKVVAEAIAAGTPLDGMILELDLCHFQVHERYAFQVKREMVRAQAAKDAATAKVVIEGGGANVNGGGPKIPLN